MSNAIILSLYSLSYLKGAVLIRPTQFQLKLQESSPLTFFYSKMGLQRLLVLFTIYVFVECEETITNSTTESITIGIKADNATQEPLDLCIVCDCTDHYINCTNRGLETHLKNTQWPSNLTAKEISFEGNLLVHITPFPRIIVNKLILRRNHITVIDNKAFKEIVNLTELDLSHNQIISELLKPHVFEGKFSPEAYEPLANLEILNLAYNMLHSLHQSVFEHLGSLKVLNISGNPFSVFDYRTSIAISSLSYLEELDMSYCDLRDIPHFQFHTAKYLKRLDLAGNSFTVLPEPLEEAKFLEYLNLDGNPIFIINGANAFPSLPNLKELHLCNMPNLVEIGNGGLSGLIGLQRLYVKNCAKLRKINEYALAQKTSEATIWPLLKKLDISENALRYLPALLIGRWDRLEELNLMNNEWSCDCDNQYLIGTLLPQYGEKLMGEKVEKLICFAPPEHAGKNLTSLATRHLRCLDLYDAQPEKDAAILVGILIGLLLAIPVGLAFFAFWRRGFFFCGPQTPASFSRAFYKRASNDDDI